MSGKATGLLVRRHPNVAAKRRRFAQDMRSIKKRRRWQAKGFAEPLTKVQMRAQAEQAIAEHAAGRE